MLKSINSLSQLELHSYKYDFASLQLFMQLIYKYKVTLWCFFDLPVFHPSPQTFLSSLPCFCLANYNRCNTSSNVNNFLSTPPSLPQPFHEEIFFQKHLEWTEGYGPNLYLSWHSLNITMQGTHRG